MEDRMEHIKAVEIKVEALSGTELGYCMKNAIELAAKEWVDVRLIHSGREYLIKPDALIESIHKIGKNK